MGAVDIPQAVRLGGMWLDQKFGPEWPTRIRRDDLDMASSECCVLAQLLGWPYHIVRDSFMVWEVHSRAEADRILESWGFDLPPEERNRVNELTAEWVRVITARQARAAVAR